MPEPLTVFVSSTSEDLAAYRRAALEVIDELPAHQFAGMERFGTGERDPTVAACRARVAAADVFLLIQAFRRGWVPAVHEGGDGRKSITAIEVDEAKAGGKPMLIFMAKESWPGNLWEDDADARAWVRNFRNGLNRFALFFAAEDRDLPAFRNLVRQELLRQWQTRLAEPAGVPEPAPLVVARLRLAPPRPELPPRPYPLLDPYKHPDTFAGRESELRELLRLLRQDRLILCMHAASGAGKSSLLLAGLAPALVTADVPVAIDRKPADAGLAERLVLDLLEREDGDVVPDDDPLAFADCLRRVHDLAGTAPVLVLDQLDDLLRQERKSRDAGLARLGPLLAATAQRMPGLQGPPCRWLLVYRHEFHGEVVEWLRDVLAQARRAEAPLPVLDQLPHDLSEPDRLQTWPLPMFGAPVAGEPAAAIEAFRSAILRPLELVNEAGTPHYATRFAPHAADRLAEAFARARERGPTLPLVPELQVVLRDLLENARDVGGVKEIEVPEEPKQLDARIGDALFHHVRDALREGFAGRDPRAARTARARALLALRELADEEGRRGEGMSGEALKRAIGEGGDAILERLASPAVRLVVPAPRDDGTGYVLSHDRLAEVVKRLVDEEAARGGLELDERLLELRRFVGQRAAMYADTGERSMLELDSRRFRKIEESADALLWTEAQREWWQECTRRRGRRRKLTWAAAAMVAVSVVVLGFIGVMAYEAYEGYEESLHGQLRTALAAGEPQTAFRVVAKLSGLPTVDEEGFREDLHDAEPRLFTEGPWPGEGLDAVSPRAVLRVVDRLHTILGDDRRHLGAMMYAVRDVAARDEALQPRARELETSILQHFNRVNERSGADARQAEASNERVRIVGGTFWMGEQSKSDDRPGYDPEANPYEGPPREVTLTTYWIQQHEVTNEEYCKFDPARCEDLPGDRLRHAVTEVDWYEATAYAAWLGGHLPTEAQWEFAVRGEEGRRYPWGNEPEPTCEHANFDECGRELAPVKEGRESGATPEGVYDLAGNAWEWCHDWYGPYSDVEAPNPSGPTTAVAVEISGEDRPARVLRGGSFYNDPIYLRGAYRGRYHPGFRDGNIGFRVSWSASGGP